MIQFHDGRLVPSRAANEFSVEVVWRREPGIVKMVCPKQAVAFRKPMVHARGEKIFVCYLLTGEREYACVALAQQAAVRHRIEPEVLLDGAIHRHAAGRECPVACGRRRNGYNVGHTQRLADRLVVSEQERLVLYDRSANGCTVLISPEWRRGSLVEEVARVQSAVA